MTRACRAVPGVLIAAVADLGQSFPLALPVPTIQCYPWPDLVSPRRGSGSKTITLGTGDSETGDSGRRIDRRDVLLGPRFASRDLESL